MDEIGKVDYKNKKTRPKFGGSFLYIQKLWKDYNSFNSQAI